VGNARPMQGRILPVRLGEAISVIVKFHYRFTRGM